MTRLPGVSAELAAAVRSVNALYAAIPAPYRPPVYGGEWGALEAKLDRACASGNRARAVAAIAAWRDYAEETLSTAMANAPLEVRQ